MIDEPLHRKANWNEEGSTWLTLSDGQQWALPRPYIAIIPEFKGGVPTHTWTYLGYSPQIDRNLEAIGQAKDLLEVIIRTVALAAQLLLHQYELSDEELSQVLVYRADDPASDEMLKAVVNIATGGLVDYGGRGVLDDPKPQPAG